MMCMHSLGTRPFVWEGSGSETSVCSMASTRGVLVGEELLSVPDVGGEEFRKPLTRSSCTYENVSDKFVVKERQYGRQYAHIYHVRLMEMTPLVQAAVRKKWGDCPIKRLMELKVGERCCIIGTLFKKMDLRPTILKEISALHHLVPQPPRVKYVGGNDELLLEDQMQRVTLTGSISSKELVTGIVVGLLGRELHSGCFEVEDFCFAELPEQEEINTMETNGEDKYVVLVSGLNLGSSWCDQLSVEMLVDYITGQLGGPAAQEFSSCIVRVIVAGNSVTDKPVKTSTNKDGKTRFLSRNYTADSIEAVKELDDVLAQLASCVPVDLMSGSHDPTNHQLPQQPLHRCMFPQANRYPTLRGVTNPYLASIGDVLFLGCSGQNVEDVFKFSTLTDRLQILENTLHWRHLAPTAPDTLSCYPYYDKDPFILDRCPHIYFSGNQPSFQHKKVRGNQGQAVLLITVPNFDLTHSCVLVNLTTLDCHELVFSTSLEREHNPELEKVREMQLSEGEATGSGQLDAEMSILHHMDMEEEEED